MCGEFLRGDRQFARSLLARWVVKLEKASFCCEKYSRLFKTQGFHSERQTNITNDHRYFGRHSSKSWLKKEPDEAQYETRWNEWRCFVTLMKQLCANFWLQCPDSISHKRQKANWMEDNPQYAYKESYRMSLNITPASASVGSLIC